MRSPCKHPGCPSLVNGNAYCEKHKRPENEKQQAKTRYDATTRRNNPALLAASEFRSTKKWQIVRRVKISINPLCEDPFKDHERRGATETAKQVHHIIPLVVCAGDSRAYDMSNLMSVCWKCHAKIEAKERANTTRRG